MKTTLVIIYIVSVLVSFLDHVYSYQRIAKAVGMKYHIITGLITALIPVVNTVTALIVLWEWHVKRKIGQRE